MVGRLAPSPTGAQHLGNARTFLLAYWSARKQGGRLVLRIEDIDSPRVKPWAIDQAVTDLKWLGIDWDEGPLIQTERADAYHRVLDGLRIENQIYPCVCTRKDIEQAGSAPHFEHELPIYPGTCAHWQEGDPVPEPGKFSWRFRSTHHPQSFDDAVQGAQSCRVAEALGDFAVTQKSGQASYQLAVVVDDIAMGVTEVVRGDDLITSTFRQLDLYRAFHHTPPAYAHVPLVTGPDGRRLAKRHGDTRLSALREDGVEPITIVRWAARTAGLISGDDSIDSADDIIERFDWKRIRKGPTQLDPPRTAPGQPWSPETT